MGFCCIGRTRDADTGCVIIHVVSRAGLRIEIVVTQRDEEPPVIYIPLARRTPIHAQPHLARSDLLTKRLAYDGKLVTNDRSAVRPRAHLKEVRV